MRFFGRSSCIQVTSVENGGISEIVLEHRDPFRVGKKTKIMINASFIDIYGIHDRLEADQLLIRAKERSAAGIT